MLSLFHILLTHHSFTMVHPCISIDLLYKVQPVCPMSMDTTTIWYDCATTLLHMFIMSYKSFKPHSSQVTSHLVTINMTTLMSNSATINTTWTCMCSYHHFVCYDENILKFPINSNQITMKKKKKTYED